MKKTVTWISLLVITTIFNGNVYAKGESDYAIEHCSSIVGELEHTLPNNTRVDCITEMSVIEYDFTYKWYECITQALYYRMITGKQAICGLIHKNGTSIEDTHVERAWSMVKHYRLPVYILEIE